MGRADDRTVVHLVHVDALRVERERERNVFTRRRSRAAQHHARRPTADVAADHFGVRGEAARCDAHAPLRGEGLRAFGRRKAHARHGEAVVVEKLDRLVFVENRNVALRAGRKQLANELSAPGDPFTFDAARAAEARIGHRADLAELHADVAFEPVDAGRDVVRVATVERAVAHLLGDVHHHLEEGFGRVFDALLLLVTGAPAADRAERVNGVAVRAVLLFENGHLGARVVCGDRGHKSRGTRTENDRVERGIRRILGVPGGGGGAREAHGGGTGGAENRRLQKSATAQFFGHVRTRMLLCWEREAEGRAKRSRPVSVT